MIDFFYNCCLQKNDLNYLYSQVHISLLNITLKNVTMQKYIKFELCHIAQQTYTLPIKKTNKPKIINLLKQREKNVNKLS